MIHPILFVGVGGSGRSTLHWIYQEIQRELIHQGWPWLERAQNGRPMPECWGFVAIDSEFRDNTEDPRVPDGAIRRVDVAKAPDNMPALRELAATGNAGLARLGWFPSAHAIPATNPADGMGQYRALGRMVSVGRMGRISDSLLKAATGVMSPTAQTDLADLAATMRRPMSTDKADCRVILISSLAGGTGSGMWLDVAQYLAGRPLTAADSWLRQGLMSILYLPEIYANLDGPSMGIAPNSMFGIGELLAAYSDRAKPDSIGEDLDRLLSANPYPTEPDAPKSCLLIGGRSSGVQFTTPTEVYGATARTITGLVLDSGTSSGFSRISVNQTNYSSIPLLKAAQVPASSIGFATLDLGYETFGDYTARRVFRNAARRLLEPEGPEEVDREQRAKDLADKLADQFFTACLLHEKNAHDGKGGERNQILAGIEGDAARRRRIRDFGDKIKDEVERVRQIRRVKPAEIKSVLKNLSSESEEDATRSLLQGAVKHGKAVRLAMLETVASYAASYSAPVVIELLELLDRQLNDAADELRDERGRSDSQSLVNLDEFASALGLDDAADYFNARCRITARDVAIPFIHFARECLVDPMKRDLKAWLIAADLDAETPSFEQDIKIWNGTEVPTDLIPPATVVMIHELDDLDSRYEHALCEAEDLPFGPAERNSVRRVVSGNWPGVPANQPAVKHPSKQAFVSEEDPFDLARIVSGESGDSDVDRVTAEQAAEAFRRLTSDVQPARFRFASLAELSTRARLWARTRSSLDSLVVTGIGGWLDPKAPDFTARQERFVSKLQLAIGRAAPLAIFDPNAVARIHGRGLAPHESTSMTPAFPFGPRSQLAASVQQLMSVLALDDSQLRYSNQEDSGRIDFIRSYPDGLHPLALASLTQPIVDEFGDPENSFWHLRRARPLSQTLGLTPAQILAMARGWLSAVLLGLVDATTGQSWIGDAEMEIPQDALALKNEQKPNDEPTWLLMAFESFLPRLMSFTVNGESVLDWYVDLAELGGYDQNIEESMVSQYGVEGPEVKAHAPRSEALSAWVASGIAPHEREVHPGIRGDDAGGRRASVETWLKEYHKSATAWQSSARSDPKVYLGKAINAEAELFPFFLTAAAQLQVALGKQSPKPGPTGFGAARSG